MDGYAMDPMEQDGPDAAPFRGGSTEQKDAFLGEKLGHTRVGSAAFHLAMHAAMDALHNPAPIVIDTVEEQAALEAIAATLFPCTLLTIFCGNLYAERRHQVGRPLTEDEVVRIDAFSRRHWQLVHGAAA